MKRISWQISVDHAAFHGWAPAWTVRDVRRLAVSNYGTLLTRVVFALLLGLWLSAHAVVFTNDTLLGPLNATCDGQDVVVSNCVLTVDGPHSFASLRVAAGGTLTHSSATNGFVPVTASVLDEPQVLTGTNPVPLLGSNVVVASVVVRDLGGTLTYAPFLDYSLGSSNQFTLLQRSEASAIPDGAGVLVSYDYVIGTANSGLNLVVAGDLEVEASAYLDASGKGYRGNYGSGHGFTNGNPAAGGGGSHGGYGGPGTGNAAGGFAYDALFQPVGKGSGGGSGSTGAGGAGGGALRLSIGGAARINGAISANGADGTNSRSGGGSGGAIWLAAQTIMGSGVISADGGVGQGMQGGGGGGGRIALYFATNQFSGSVLARGASGFVGGGAGTIYCQAADLSQMQVVVDNGGRSGTNTSVQVTNGADLLITGASLASPSGSQNMGNLFIASGCCLTPPGPQQVVTVTASNATVQAGAGILLDSAGYGAGAGTGYGGSCQVGSINWGNGAGHGGFGGWNGNSSCGAPLGNSYGSATAPHTFGSGGGGFYASGGAGGGVLRLIVPGALLLDGRITAKGESGRGPGGGGGSGGSLGLIVGTIFGSGSLCADGGDGIPPHAGGGGGGRILLEFVTNLFSGTITAYGGNGTNRGGAGTVYLKPAGQNGTLVLDNAGQAGTNTPVSLSGTDALAIVGAAHGVLLSPVTVSGLLVRSNCSLFSASVLGSTVSLTVNGDALVEKGAGISANGLGSIPTQGAGYGRDNGPIGGGAGHGGYGAPGTDSRALGGTTYGLYNTPTNAGSGGGGIGNSFLLGGQGGGVLRVIVQGALTLDGTVSADADDASGSGGGGGSGGSVWVTVTQLSGAGLMSANGGDGGAPSGGGGGGGRVAIEYTAPQTNAFAGLMTAYGGNGATRGGAGTVYLSPSGQPPLLMVDNGGYAGTNTPVPTYGTFGLSLKGGAAAVVAVPQTFTSLLVGSNGTLITAYPYYHSASDVIINGNATIERGGRLQVDGWGNPANYGDGPGRYCYSNSVLYGGGGGYGGPGGPGAYACASGGASYGSVVHPTDVGSGGGGWSGGGLGGGWVGLTVTGILSVDGAISASGMDGIWPGNGGGSGGSIALTAGMLTGAGRISANGGNGDPARGGGGGGGRIAITYSTNLFTGILSADGGSGWSNGGAGTIYTKANLTVPAIFPLLSNGVNGPNLCLCWPGIQGLTYQAQWSTNLFNWLPWGTALAGSNGLMEVVAPITTNGQTFFRLKTTN